ncbi:sulfite reductase [Endozoicomonas montiporae]|uniref:Sulfite reductase n=2 Tax=Endozoicomonas montiporae TaxID=1027273 RepID=A0A081NB14_9GAMM|nr:nitrite/sulfite reductase [Endozoicomonas montiporae]AMO56655.1 sulfite reductase (NADPH) hemoprotein beta-component [Endozoicomonas montiporae CL-33]KEQ15637.1 sulfite reductase [Endozoicomonas montiporae]
MYIYDEYDQRIVDERVDQFRDQTRRYLAGEMTEDQFLPLRLQNGLYIQRFAPMMRIAIPYGLLSTRQVRKLADISRQYDKGYVHFTTRQNVQLNWPRLEQVPDILAELATVQMHAIQTSGACIRNTTTDPFAGVAADETVDPRPWCELIRQWSTFHPEFAFLPRKFKIAVCGSEEDRAATLVHDIGVHLHRDREGKINISILAGGGLGRTPVIGSVIKEDLEPAQLLNYLDATLRIYNLYGRRDNKYKARIKILVKAMTPEVFARQVEEEWHRIRAVTEPLNQQEIDRVSAHFTRPDYDSLADQDFNDLSLQGSASFQRWLKQNVSPHQQPGYSAVTLTLKATSDAPGDVSAEQLDVIADLADQYSYGELRVTHEQNLVFADVPQHELPKLWQALDNIGLATPNRGLLTDIICCPGGDYCALANARSIPLAEEIQQYFEDLDYLHDIGELDLNLSGCMNACAHHHVGHIGILGVDRKGEEYYQIQIGGSSAKSASLGKIIGPSFKREEVPDVIKQLMSVYLERRHEGERFVDTSLRLGLEPFKEKVYGQKAA